MAGGRIDILPAGSRAMLVAPQDRTGIDTLTHALRHSCPEGITDILPAAQTIMVTTAPGTDLRMLAERLHQLLTAVECNEDAAENEAALVRIPVTYTGADLDDVAAILGITAEEVIREHTGRVWRCAFVGFAPGFGYLESSEPGLAVPRREQSRTAVPPGAVALADGYSAIYPRRSPGGWQLIGTTSATVWDLGRPEPALIRPGCRVQFFAEDIR
jgi:KipI family sensor histidine kinase inhibitor